VASRRLLRAKSNGQSSSPCGGAHPPKSKQCFGRLFRRSRRSCTIVLPAISKITRVFEKELDERVPEDCQRSEPACYAPLSSSILLLRPLDSIGASRRGTLGPQVHKLSSFFHSHSFTSFLGGSIHGDDGARVVADYDNNE
jgi:hypothetical protein